MEDTKELVLKCHQPDKNKYMIAFDASNETTTATERHSDQPQDQSPSSSRLNFFHPTAGARLHDSISLNNYLTASLYRLSKAQEKSSQEDEAKKVLENNMNQNNNTLTDDDSSSGTLTFLTATENSPRVQRHENHNYVRSQPLLSSNPLTDDDDYHDQLEHNHDDDFGFVFRRSRATTQSNSRRSPFIPIFDLQATSYTSRSPTTPVNEFPSNSSQSRMPRKKPTMSTSGSEEQSSYSSIVSSSDASSPFITSPSRDTDQVISTSNASKPTQSYIRNYDPSPQYSPACLQVLERLKQGSSPIREEDEPSSDSSRADVDMNSNESNGRDAIRRRKESRDGSLVDFNLNLRTKRHSFGARPKSSSVDVPTSYSSRAGWTGRDGNLSSHHEYPVYGTNHNYRQNRSGEQLNHNMYHHPQMTQGHINPYNPFDPMSAGYATRGQFRVRSAPQTPVVSRMHSNGFYGPPQAMNQQTDDYECGSRKNQASTPVQDKSQKKVYVCYPNYSLPDLSFLLNPGVKQSPVQDAEVLLSPTKPIGRSSTSSFPSTASSASQGMQRRTNTHSQKQRPKSFNDIDNLTKSTIQGVRDWESLNFLLPDKVKTLIGSRGLQPVPEGSVAETSLGSSLSGSSNKHPPKFVRMRHRILPQVPIAQKRRSLQEPLMSPLMTPTNQGGLTRSESMPFHSHCHCQMARVWNHCCQGNVAPVYCHGNEGINCSSHGCCSGHTSSVCHSTGKSSTDDDSIDTLCNLLSMQEEMTEVGELFKLFWSSKSENKKPDLKTNPPSKPNFLPIRCSAGFKKSMIPVPKSKSPSKIPPNVIPRKH